ncbi:MAG: ribosome assembly RNA-binding protein YhbY [Acutalibacteraceae bacterium]|nr:ribosome assembly RNA-binding protein YhbY [Acutalibacteraceae bacterium]
MLNSKQRAMLRGMANSLEPIFQVGKGGINDQLIRQVDETLEKRELIKITTLENTPETSKEAADIIASQTGADVVQVIGRKIVLFRKRKEKSKDPKTNPKISDLISKIGKKK